MQYSYTFPICNIPISITILICLKYTQDLMNLVITNGNGFLRHKNVCVWGYIISKKNALLGVYSLPMVPRVLWYRGIYLSVPMHCSATCQFFYLYIHKHNSHIYRNVWSFCPNVLNFWKYTYFYLFLRNSGHFYFTLIPCFVKCPIIKP
jgi:hypothetical protein